MVKTEFIGMINILSSKKIIQELLQDEVTAENIAKNTLALLGNKEKYEDLKNALKNIKEILSPYGATEKFSAFIGDFLKLS
jgi:lipid-A-disaccharide synthase